jgi:hypothetical protein
MSQAPSTYEESLDMSLITALAAHSLPILVDPGWVIRFQTHFLGGRRHHYNWEIADIGLIILFRSGGITRRTKVVLLQSKRLYPIEQDADELDISDYLVGMARLSVPDDPWVNIITGKTLSFTSDSEYRTLRRGDRQRQLIADYESKRGIPVHYLLYNPWSVPHQVLTPAESPVAISGECSAGARVFRSSHIRKIGESDPKFRYSTISAAFTDEAEPGKSAGWRLADFVTDLAIDCHEGYSASSPDDPGLVQIFAGRAGPISSAVSIVIDAPAGS